MTGAEYLKGRLKELGVAHFVSDECIKELVGSAERFIAIISHQSDNAKKSAQARAAMDNIAKFVYGYFYPHNAEKVMGPHAKALTGWSTHPIYEILDKHSTGGKAGK